MTLKRHSLLLASLSLGLLLAASLHAVQGPEMTVYKTATCGCCGKWVDHIKNNGFRVTVHEVADVSEYKQRYGVPKELESCHTAIVEGYTIEGHVPATDIHRLLKEKPAAKGLAVPGMPFGSPGMEMGDRKNAYDVLLFTDDGKTSVFQHHKGN